MASIRKKKGGYEIIFTDRSRDPYQVHLFFGDEFENEIKEIKEDLERDYKYFKINKGGRDPWEMRGGNNPTLPTAVKNFIHHKTVETEAWGSNTEGNLQNVLKRFSDSNPNVRIRNLTKDKLDNFINEPGLARATKESRLKPIKGMLRWFDVDITYPPIRGNKQQKQVKYIREPEVQMVNETIMKKVRSDIEKGYQTKDRNSLWLINLLTWSFYAGTRPSETLRLRPRDYDEINKLVSIRRKTKNKVDRTLPIGKVNILKQIMGNLTDPEVISNLKDNSYWKSDRIFGHYDQKRTSKNIKKYIRLAFKGIDEERGEELDWYSYRHGCAVWLVSNGVPIFSVAKWLGHKDVEVTQKYYADVIQKDLGNQIAQAHN